MTGKIKQLIESRAGKNSFIQNSNLEITIEKLICSRFLFIREIRKDNLLNQYLIKQFGGAK